MYYLNDLDLHNFADNNTVTATCKDSNDPLHTLEKEAERMILEYN